MAEDNIAEIVDPEALYNQGMAYYRRRLWREAKVCFEQVRALQPSRRGIDALLRELDIFLQLESVENDRSTETTIVETGQIEAEQEAQTATHPEIRRRGHGWLIAVAVLIISALVIGFVYAYRQGLLPFARDERENTLRNLGQAYLVAQQYDKAFGVYTKLIALAPSDPEVINGLDKAQNGLYEGALNQEKAGNIPEAIKGYKTLCAADSGYKDACVRIEQLEMQQELDKQYLEARKYLDSQAFGEAIKVLLKLRTLDADYKPGAIGDDLYEAYTRQAQQLIELVGAEIKPAVNPKAEEPRFAVTDSVLGNLRQAISAFDKALVERPASEKIVAAKTLAAGLNEGLERYRDWAWEESIVALKAVYDRDPAYCSGKAAAALCDAYLHQGDLLAQAKEYLAALAQYQAMQQIAECDPALAQERAEQAGAFLTPTATATATVLPTATATFTRRPTPTPTITATFTPEPTPTPVSGGGGGGGSQPAPTSKPKPPARR